MTEQGLQKSMKNMLQQAKLWLDSKEISALRYDDICWVENSNLDCTYTHEITTKIEKAIITVAKENPTVAA